VEGFYYLEKLFWFEKVQDKMIEVAVYIIAEYKYWLLRALFCRYHRQVEKLKSSVILNVDSSK